MRLQYSGCGQRYSRLVGAAYIRVSAQMYDKVQYKFKIYRLAALS